MQEFNERVVLLAIFQNRAQTTIFLKYSKTMVV